MPGLGLPFLPRAGLLPSREGQLVQIDRISSFINVAVHLVINRNSVPTGGGRRVIAAHSCGIAIERDGFVEQVAI